VLWYFNLISLEMRGQIVNRVFNFAGVAIDASKRRVFLL
jgi:hypothetical protein